MKADRLVVPGVGAFKNCMITLKKYNLIDTLIEFSNSNKPYLGICVGMQMMLEKKMLELSSRLILFFMGFLSSSVCVVGLFAFQSRKKKRYSQIQTAKEICNTEDDITAEEKEKLSNGINSFCKTEYSDSIVSNIKDYELVAPQLLSRHVTIIFQPEWGIRFGIRSPYVVNFNQF